MPTIFRRGVLFLAATTALGSAIRKVAAQTAPASVAAGSGPSYPFALPPLPYAFSANEPSIDAQTMELHHDKHHAAYVANLNAAVKDYPQVAAMTLVAMLSRLNELPDSIRSAVRNNGGGHANHSMFWPIMGGKGGNPQGELGNAITRDFGSFTQLKTDFNKAGAGQFGSGWAMVMVDAQGKLSLVARPNQGLASRRRQASAVRQRRLGARLLPEIPEPAPGLPGRLVERGELASDRPALPGCPGRHPSRLSDHTKEIRR